LRSSANLEKTDIKLIAAARPTSTFWPATLLLIADHR
jgi:hypothetical protein